MPLSKKEIDKLIKKLRDKYSEYSIKHNSKWFNLQPFEDRLTMAKKNKMNLEAFMLAEITNFEKIKEKFETKKNEKSFSEKIDEIIEKNFEMIKKYPAIKFHNYADAEMTHCYGALSELGQYYLPVLRILVTDKFHKNSLNDFEDQIQFLAVQRGKLPPKRIEDHILILSRTDVKDIEIERDRNEYLKESAFLLHEIFDFCDGIIHNRNEEWEQPVTFTKLYIDEKKKNRLIQNFSSLTGYGAILRIKEYCENIINDFRLGAFRKTN